MKITREYIKGFFDGEGCISVIAKANNRFGGQVAIVNTDKTIIEAVSQELKKLGIQNIIDYLKEYKGKDGGIRKPKYNIRITNMWGVYQFYKKIGTNHPDKKAKFDFLIKNSVNLQYYLRANENIPRAKLLRYKGLSWREISQTLGINRHTVCSWFNGRTPYKWIKNPVML